MELAKEKQRSIYDGADHNSCIMQKFKLYETRSKFYMIGRDKSRTCWRVLKIDRLETAELNITEDSMTYSEFECCDLLRRIHEGNRSTGGLKFVTTCYGIIGFIKFLEPYYMLLITNRRKIGTICGHAVYTITKSEMIPVPHPSARSKMAYSKDENRSLVHSTCKCNMSTVHLKRHLSVALSITPFPLYLDENNVIYYGFSFEFALLLSDNIMFVLLSKKLFERHIVGAFFVLYMLISFFSVYTQSGHPQVNLVMFLWYYLLVSFLCPIIFVVVTCIILFSCPTLFCQFISCICTGAIFIAVVM